MRSTDIATTPYPDAPRLQLVGNNNRLVGDRPAFYCTDLVEFEPIPGVTISIHHMLLVDVPAPREVDHA